MSGWAKVFWLRFLRVWKMTLVISVSATVAAAVCQHFDIFQMMEAEIDAYDEGLEDMTEWLGSPKKSDDIVILAIDDTTIQGVSKNASYARNFGNWPWSRNVWARVFEHLDREGARAIIFDAMIDERHTDPTGDLAMGAIVRQIATPYYMGFSLNASSI